MQACAWLTTTAVSAARQRIAKPRRIARSSSLTNFEGDEPSDQTFELVWQRLRQARQVVGVQLTTMRSMKRALIFVMAFPYVQFQIATRAVDYQI